MNQDLPMGISQWREHGRRYGYWDYFLTRTIGYVMDVTDKEGPILLETICDNCKNYQGNGEFEFTCEECKTRYVATQYRKGKRKLFIYILSK